jgi:hypothetical protein
MLANYKPTWRQWSLNNKEFKMKGNFKKSADVRTKGQRVVVVDATPLKLKDRARRRIIRGVLRELRSLERPTAADIADVMGPAPRRAR